MHLVDPGPEVLWVVDFQIPEPPDPHEAYLITFRLGQEEKLS